MTNIEELIGQLQVISERANSNIKSLERERNYVLETMEKVQKSFGDQRPGQQMVTELYHAINSMAFTDSSLNALRTAIDRYINQLKK